MDPETDPCTICLDDLPSTDSEERYELNCKHVFHRDCITKWLHTSPNCPLCRKPVDADERYVDDGIMSEEQRQYIETLKGFCNLTALGLETIFPTGLRGYTERAAQLLESQEGEELLQEAGDVTTGSKNLVSAMGLTMLSQFIENDGLKNLSEWFDQNSP